MWVRRSNRWRLFGVRRGAARRYSEFDLHRSVGVIGNMLLLLVAATGVVIAFPQTFTQTAGRPSAAPRPGSVAENSAATTRPSKQYIAAGGAGMPFPAAQSNNCGFHARRIARWYRSYPDVWRFTAQRREHAS